MNPSLGIQGLSVVVTEPEQLFSFSHLFLQILSNIVNFALNLSFGQIDFGTDFLIRVTFEYVSQYKHTARIFIQT